MFSALHYYWIVARGYRLRPWDSPYLRWRLETFAGAEAADMNATKFFQMMWKYRKQMESFMAWAAERRKAQHHARG